MQFELTSWKMEYAKALPEVLGNPQILANLRDGIPYPYTERDGEDFIRQTLSAPEGSQYAFALLVDGMLAGSIGIFRQQNIHRFTAELGYYLAEPLWGRGIMSNAVAEACHRVFECSDLVRIFAEPFAENAGSCRVLEKAGFTLEGTLRLNAFKAGRLLDMKLYALLRE